MWGSDYNMLSSSAAVQLHQKLPTDHHSSAFTMQHCSLIMQQRVPHALAFACTHAA